jgi:anti-sigma B factor antagonist
MAFGIEQEQQGAVRILALSGRLDTETSADLELALQDLQAAGANHFLIDMTAIGYVSSAGLRVLLALAKQLDGGRGSLRLCELNAAVMQVFDVAGFSKLFSIYPTRAAALAGHAEARPDPSLARSVASLIGAPETDSSAAAHPKSAELARVAAQLLTAEKADDAAKPAVEPAKPKPPSAPQPKPALAPAQVPQAAPAGEAPGVLGKLKNLFGGKR